jgi:aminoglycoside 6'-N-acetyltransferase I
MQIEPITEENIVALTTLIWDLWTDCSFDEEYENCKRILTSETETCYLTKEKENYIAFIYVSIRTDYVEGSTSSPIAYLEGLYVKPAYRKRGVGRKLVEPWSGLGKTERMYTVRF